MQNLARWQWQRDGRSNHGSHSRVVARCAANARYAVRGVTYKGVRFSVYAKDGKAAIKASAIR